MKGVQCHLCGWLTNRLKNNLILLAYISIQCILLVHITNKFVERAIYKRDLQINEFGRSRPTNSVFRRTIRSGIGLRLIIRGAHVHIFI
jgi:hypothetical protein